MLLDDILNAVRSVFLSISWQERLNLNTVAQSSKNLKNVHQLLNKVI